MTGDPLDGNGIAATVFRPHIDKWCPM